MNWHWKSFSELSGDEFYAIMVIRQLVFIVEQKINCLDVDGIDQQCWHLFGTANSSATGPGNPILAYARILPPGLRYSEVAIGRVATASEVRGQGVGRALMLEAMARIEQQYGAVAIRISAQAYLEKFYHSLRFKTVSAPYIEEEVLHVQMLYEPNRDQNEFHGV